MKMLVLISFIFLIVFLLVNLRIRNARLILRNDLRIFYDKLELQFLKEGVVLDNSTIRFLQSFKSPAEHPDFLDIQVLWVTHKLANYKDIKETRVKFNKVNDSLSDESKEIIKHFNIACSKMIMLSMFRIDFVVWAFGKILRAVSKSVFKMSISPMVSIYKYATEVQNDLHVTVSIYNMPKYKDTGLRMAS